MDQLRDRGILNQIKRKYFLSEVQPKTKNFNSVGISGIVILLVILSGGIILGIILLVLEKVHYKHRLGNS